MSESDSVGYGRLPAQEGALVEDSFKFWEPRTLWKWDVFGGGLVVANCTFEVPLWSRILTRVFLGSVWERQ